MNKIAIHSVRMANYLLENQVPMLNMTQNKKDRIGLVFYFESTERTQQLMDNYSLHRQ